MKGFDVRAAVKEQVESMGGEFLQVTHTTLAFYLISRTLIFCNHIRMAAL